MKPHQILAFAVCLVLPGRISAAAGAEVEWSQFRGPNGSGVANSFDAPVKVAADQAAWRTPLPPGRSSPALWKGRIYLTGVEAGRLVTLALDAQSGKRLWTRQAPEVPLEPVHAANSPAASTPCADATGVYVHFGSYGLLGYDHDGRALWQKAIPKPQNMYGVATSPILHGDRLILVADDDASLPDSQLSRSKVMALDTATGETVWETARPHNRGAWSTPMIWQHDQGTDLVVLGNGRVYGYDPATGAEKWYVTGFAREPIAVPVAGDGRLFVSVSMQGGRGDVQMDPEPFWTALLPLDRNSDGRIGRDEITPAFTLPFRPELPLGHPGFGMPLPDDPAKRRESQEKIFNWRDKDRDGFWTREEFVAEMTVGQGRPSLAAIRPGGTGDATASHVSWNLRNGIPEIASPVFHAGRLYLIRDGGVLSCVNAATGEIVYRERLGAAGQYASSPVIARDRLYLLSAKGVLTVVKTGDRFEIEHQADLAVSISATPAMDRHSLYVRSDDALLAFRSGSRLSPAGDPAATGGGGAKNSPIASTVRRSMAENQTGQFIEARFASDKGGALPLQIFIPTNSAEGTRHPLLVFLHGAGELGDDNRQQLATFPRVFVNPENQAKHPCFVVAPQCPKSDAWSSFPEYPANARAAASPTAATRIAIELVEALIAEGSIDPSRVYVTGLSLGGEGTFDIVSRRPDLFAAAVPICGIADVERAAAMASVPFWIFHGERDDINPVKYSRDAFQALKAKGATPIYTEYPGAGHDIWDRTYSDPGLIPWLFKQRKGTHP